MNKNNAFFPGKPWLDDNGNRIHAHGGSMFIENGTFYWYGENKEKNTPKNSVWHYGVRCYSSKDLYNWHDEGLILPPDLTEDPTNVLHPNRIIDRPHIVYNKKTGKYVMWIKLAGSNERPHDWTIQKMAVATSDSLTGKYSLQKILFPGGFKSGDMDIAVDDNTGDAYIYFGKILTHPSDMICLKLTDDYMDVTGEPSVFFQFGSPPDAREAPCCFVRNNKKYLITSGTTGYHPNPSIIAAADDYQGPFEILGDACQNDITKSTFHSQVSCVFKYPGTDLYIAMADRWLSDLDLTKLPWITEGYRILQSEPPADTHGLTWEQVRQYSSRNISLADYVWLPICFKNDRPVIKWYDSWKIEDFI